MNDPTFSYVFFAFMGFMGLLQIAILGMLVRMNYTMGRMQGDINGLRDAIAALTVRVERLEDQVIDLRNQIADLREQMGEIRGSLRAVHDRIDLVMRHRHDGQTGGVILTPTAPSPEPVADPAGD